MKFKRFFAIFGLSSMMVAGALFAVEGAKVSKFVQAKAITDIGEVTIGEVRNAISNASTLYLLPTENYDDLPSSWDHAYSGADESSGVFVDGVRTALVLKYADTGSAHITFWCGLSSAAVEGTEVEFKGTFVSETSGKSFSINYAAQRFAETWVHALEDYDTVSLKDANMPNFESGAAINTDAIGSDYNYVTDPAGLPKQKGFFGLTNNTGSYAFQFNYQKTSTGTGWFDVLIGASGTLYSTGHFIDFGFLDGWADTGHAQIHEMTGSGDNWAKNVIQETGAIALGWNVGESNLLEMGLIKVKNSNLRYVFFKVNGILKFGDYWTLTDGGMTTKVCMVYNGTDAIVTNSLEPISTRLSPSTYVPEDKYFYMNMANDACPAVNNWGDYFMSVDGNGLKLNGNPFGVSNWNYFKKTGATQMFLALGGDIGITPVPGDILYVGGMFKAAREVDGVKVLFKVNFADSYFQFNGEGWASINPNYEAGDFAKDLLKMTRTICTGAGGDNHDALVTVWTVLANENYFGSLVLAEKSVLKNATADSTIVVPAAEADINDMLPEDAIAAAMYRYDYCTAKYSLTNFVAGRTLSVSFSNTRIFDTVTNGNMTIVWIMIASSITLIGVSALLVLRRRKEDR